MEPESQWNVFVPRQLWKESPGFLFGCVDLDNCLVYVGGISRRVWDAPSLQTVGFWQGTEQDPCHTKPSKIQSGLCWISLKVEEGKSYCSLLIKSASGFSEPRPVVCITFDPDEVMKSFILTRSDSDHNDERTLGCEKNNKTAIAGSAAQEICSEKTSGPHGHTDQHETQRLKSEKQDLLTSLTHILKRLFSHHLPFPNDAKIFYLPPKQQPRAYFRIPLFVVSIICFLEKIIKTGYQGIRFCCKPLPRILQTPSTYQYLQDKGCLYRTCFSLGKSKSLSRFILYNCYCQQLLDSFIGLTLIVLVSSYSIHRLAALFILDWADGVAGQLTDLVKWLMGAPAGLKLNAQLTNFLGHFFIYHIYLWSGYLSLLRSTLSTLLWYSSLVGVLGVSAQLCLLRDLLSMLTLHIYCFYVYAAKIFSLQVYMLGSLWRLFRGKKWNVLRSRVDSAVYSTDQLFVGTLFFTVLLFLLPTTALYYAVFTLLRLGALTVQGCLGYVYNTIMSAPVFTLILKVLRPKLVAGNVKFTVRHALLDKQCLMLHMQTCQIPMKDLLGITQPFLRPAGKESLTLFQFVTHLATGRLIYPWVEPHMAVQQDKKLN